MRKILPILLPVVLAAPAALRAQTAVAPAASERAGTVSAGNPTSESPDQQDREENQARQDLQRAATAPREPSAPAAGPSIRLDVPVLRLRRPDAEMETAAWLGVSVTSPPSALIHQLKLPAGTALVVDFAQPGSPAAKAGLRKYDLLLKLNDQLLINSEQLAVLVRTFKPDEKIQLTLLREGKRQTVQITLVGREMPPLDQETVQPGTTQGIWGAQPVPQGAVEQTPGMNGAVPRTSPDAPRIQGEYFNAAPRPIPWVGSSVTWSEGKRMFILNRVDDHRNLMVLSPERKIEFQGNIDTPEQIKSLEPEIRRSLQRMEAMTAAGRDPLAEKAPAADKGGTTPALPNPASR